MDRAAIVHENFLRRTAEVDLPPGGPPDGGLPPHLALEIFRAQLLSRALDRQSRVMQKAGRGYYTIGSSGHEGMAAIAAALRPTDPAFLHYRDAAFQIMRSRQVPGQTIAWDMLLSFACAAEDPISGGRHKVLGSRALMIPPQTSTIASHLPKSVGAAYSIGVSRRIDPEHRLFERARQALEKSWQFRARLSERERLRLNADRAALNGEHQQAIIAYERLFSRYRDDVLALKSQAILKEMLGTAGGGLGNLELARAMDATDWPPLSRVARYFGYRGDLPQLD